MKAPAAHTAPSQACEPEQAPLACTLEEAPLRRAKQKLDEEAVTQILNTATSGVLALATPDAQPYAVPLSYVYTNGALYFHSSRKGLKVQLISENAAASFCVIGRDNPLGPAFATDYQSVIALGTIALVEDETERLLALNELGKKYAPGKRAARQREIEHDGPHAAVLRLDPTSITGKQASEKVRERANDLRVSPATHKSMQGNKRANTKPELLVRERLRAAGLTGYRLQWKVPGRPDIAWPGKKVALFVNGCYWHRCPYCSPSVPKKNVEYWSVKFERNQERDKQALAELEAAGWKTHVVWECQLKKDKREETFAELLPKLADELGKQIDSSAE